MRFLGIGEDCSLGDMYLRLAADGHEVRVYTGEENAAGAMTGMIDRTPDWHRELSWLREGNGIAIFESVGMGETQDALRRDGFPVIGGSRFGDRLELDREFGQQAMRDAGMKTAGSCCFDDFQSGVDYVRRYPKRYVFKLNGSDFAPGRNYVGQMDDGADVAALLTRHQAMWHLPEHPSFILMDHVTGVEIGVGGYFNGETFMDAVVVDFEHKHFFDGDLGELTGEMGTLVSYEHSRRLFDATLKRMTGQLRDGGYVGYVNMNTIVNADGIWPLEFTSRFGYPGFAICDALHEESWAYLFARMIGKQRLDFRTHAGFAVGVALTVPPFPHPDRYEQISKGLPILFRGELSEEDRRHLHYSEVEMRDGQLLTSGEIGYLMVATGRGRRVEDAQANAYALAKRVVVPNLRYRADIGARFLREDRARLQRWGLWPECVSV